MREVRCGFCVTYQVCCLNQAVGKAELVPRVLSRTFLFPP